MVAACNVWLCGSCWLKLWQLQLFFSFILHYSFSLHYIFQSTAKNVQKKFMVTYCLAVIGVVFSLVLGATSLIEVQELINILCATGFQPKCHLD